MLTIEEAKRLLDVIKDDRLEAFWICALTLGLRRGELLGLRWDDIDFANGLLAVRQTLQRADGSLQFVDPKTDRSRRVVPAPDLDLGGAPQAQAGSGGRTARRRQAVAEPRAHLPFHHRNAHRAGQPQHPVAGHPEEGGAELGLRRLHDLRHACASFLLASGASPRTVMKTLGHSQIGLTMNTYTHVLPDIERAAVDAVAKKLFG